MRIFAIFLILTFVAPYAFAAGGLAKTFSYEGSLTDSSEAPVLDPSVSFTLTIYNPAKTCVLYEETQTANTMLTGGHFALDFGSATGAAKRTAQDSGNTMTAIFQNSSAIPGKGGSCVGLSYTPADGDARYLRVTVTPSTTMVTDTLSPDLAIGSVPTAMVAETLQGSVPADFVKVKDDGSTDLNQTNVEYAFNSTNWARLKNLVDGTSTQYLSSVPSATIDWNNQRLTNIAAPSAGSDAVNKTYSDSYIGGHLADLTSVGPGIGDGKALLWDQTAQKWKAGTVVASDSTKLPLSGGTMTGAINMGDFNITATGHITMSTNKVLTLGTLDGTQESNLVGTLTVANKGASWYNTTSNVHKIWNGTAAVAQADSTTSLAPTGSAGGDLNGTYPNPTLASGVVTNTKLANDSITSSKIRSTGIGANQLIATDFPTGNNLTYFVCDPNEIMVWSGATGWTCDTVAAHSPVTSVAGRTGAITLTTADVSGLSTGAFKDHGTLADNLVLLDGSARIPAVNGSLLTNVNAVKLQTYAVSNSMPNVGHVLAWSGTEWSPATPAGPVFPLLANPGNATSTAPSYSFDGDTGTGMYSPTAGSLAFATSSGTRVLIDGSGNVGIGTSPGAKLDVNGVASVSAGIERVSAYANSTAAYTVPDTALNIRKVTLNANTTITLPTFTTSGRLWTLTIFVKQDATGGRSLAWDAGGDTISWDQSAGAPPVGTAANKISIYQFIKTGDETVWYGSQIWKQY